MTGKPVPKEGADEADPFASDTGPQTTAE